MKTISIETPIHGRVLIEDPVAANTDSRFLVGFHGYSQNAEDMLGELERIPGSGEWTRVSIQALHRFYSRGSERVVASWMTREDRDLAIADNIGYVDTVVRSLLANAPQAPIVFVGFSQGVAMAYRAGILGAHRARGVIAIGGDIPPEVKAEPADRFPVILLAGGKSDSLYTPAKLDADEAFLVSIGVPHDVLRYPGGHEWTETLRDRIHRALDPIVRNSLTI
jgi:predicted esterase